MRRYDQCISTVTYAALDLSFVDINPGCEPRGVVSFFVKWALSTANGIVFPVNLESTKNALSLYEKHGLTAVKRITMVLKEGSNTGANSTCAEVCFDPPAVFMWSNASNSRKDSMPRVRQSGYSFEPSNLKSSFIFLPPKLASCSESQYNFTVCRSSNGLMVVR